jgi:hypothetical protein
LSHFIFKLSLQIKVSAHRALRLLPGFASQMAINKSSAHRALRLLPGFASQMAINKSSAHRAPSPFAKICFANGDK